MIKKTAFNLKNEKIKSNIEEEIISRNIFTVVLVNSKKYEINLLEKTKFRVRHNCLYRGLFKKLGKIDHIEIKGNR